MSIQVLVGNSLEVLPTLEKNSVHCFMTSPPYYGLRKYQGDQQCDWPRAEYSPMPGLPPIAIEPMTCALGHESTIEAYVGHLVAIYREVWRVLRDDGVAWVVMGDSYAANRSYQVPDTKWRDVGNDKGSRTPNSLQQGDLMLVPHRLALALQADGWLVRNDDVWAKVAPMPESVSGWRWERHRVKVKGAPAGTRNVDNRNRQGDPAHSGGYRSDVANNPTARWIDCPGCPKCEPNDGYILKRGSWRHTRAHEFVFMLAKGMQYWSNQEAVRETLASGSIERYNYGFGGDKNEHLKASDKPTAVVGDREPTGRNPRSVLSPSPEPFPGPHFAVFPTGLIEPLIKATCPDKCCPECGAGWSPVVEHETAVPQRTGEWKATGENYRNDLGRKGGFYINPNVLGYRPTCGCGRDDHIPGVCLDHFFGAGTVGLVCDRLGLDCIGIDISEKYAVNIAKERIVSDAPLFADVAVRKGI